MKDFTCVNYSYQDPQNRLPGKKAKCSSKQPQHKFLSTPQSKPKSRENASSIISVTIIAKDLSSRSNATDEKKILEA